MPCDEFRCKDPGVIGKEPCASLISLIEEGLSPLPSLILPLGTIAVRYGEPGSELGWLFD